MWVQYIGKFRVKIRECLYISKCRITDGGMAREYLDIHPNVLWYYNVFIYFCHLSLLWHKLNVFLDCFSGFELLGLENIPEDGPVLIIYYHGVIPIDLYYVMAKCLLEKRRQIHAVGDRFLFKIPGIFWFVLLFFVVEGRIFR